MRGWMCVVSIVVGAPPRALLPRAPVSITRKAKVRVLLGSLPHTHCVARCSGALMSTRAATALRIFVAYIGCGCNAMNACALPCVPGPASNVRKPVRRAPYRLESQSWAALGAGPKPAALRSPAESSGKRGWRTGRRLEIFAQQASAGKGAGKGSWRAI